jgi:integrase
VEQFISDSYAARAVEGFSWDNEIPGFGIRVYSTGKRSFIYRTTHGNHRLLKVIGRFPAISAEEARQIAKNLYLRELTSHGIPRARTFAELAHDYIELYAKVKKKSWMNDLYALDKHVLPYLKDRRIAEINKRDIEVLFARVSHKTPIAANRVLTLLRKMFALAIEWGELEKNPTTGIRKNHETSRDTFITRDQYPAFLRALEKETPEIQAIIKLLLLTGRRKSELLSAKWVDVDFDSRLLRAGSTKNKVGSPQ